MTEHLDIIIVGAGLSGISAAYHLQTRCQRKSYAILEARDAIGGTWDLFRYPGVRSDSDMFTLGFRWKPWTKPKAIADGSTILDYVREGAREHGIDKKIRFGHRLTRAAWSTERSRWTLDTETPDGEIRRFTCNFLYMGSGYYRYDAGHTPQFEGAKDFKGQIVHPQHWGSDVSYAGKRVVVIGSGATAMTLVPELAKQAAHVTMLQRSPTYVISRPARDGFANLLRACLPASLAYAATRWKNVVLSILFFEFTRRWPELAKRVLIGRVQDELPGIDVGQHFTPRYNPWDQRLCLVPDSDLFEALRSGRASVVTDHIERFTERGVLLRSGELLEADLIVTATGLELQVLGGAEFTVDQRRVEISKHLGYKGCLISDVPNMANAFGYTNASWTLKADLTAEFVCRLLNRMEERGMDRCVPRRDPTVREEPWLDFSSGYVQRGLSRLPKQGSKFPFRVHQNYARDLLAMRFGDIDDGTLEFGSSRNDRAQSERAAAKALHAQETQLEQQ